MTCVLQHYSRFKVSIILSVSIFFKRVLLTLLNY